MIYLLDHNVLSEVWRPQPDAAVVAFLNEAEWFVPVPVIAEIQEGAEAAPNAVRRIEINSRLDIFLRRNAAVILDWDSETARVWGRLKHSPEVKRQPQPLWDSLIDALAVRHGCAVATRNGKDFRHARTFDPWQFLAHPSLMSRGDRRLTPFRSPENAFFPVKASVS
jgi:predicted nucleic acid-binding protein